MSQFHEDIREILNDVYKYLTNTISMESVSTYAKSENDNLCMKITALHQRYPQLQLNINKLPQPLDPVELSKSGSVSYVDMHGHEGILGSKPPDTHEFEKCGFLEKKGKEHLKGLISMTQKRWYGIKNGLLYYYDKSSNEVQKGTIPLAGYEGELVKDKKNSHSFQITCPGKRTYQFVATSAEDLEQWVAAINKNSKANENKTLLKQVSQSSNVEQGEDLYEIVSDEEDTSKEKEKPVTNALKSKRNGAILPPNLNVRSGIGNESYMWDFSQYYVALWDCKANDSSELDFLHGDIIRVVSKEHDAYEWWIGELDGKIGFVPKSYLLEAYEE